MEYSVDSKRSDPIINPIPRSDNPYISVIRTDNVLQDAAKNFLSQ